MKRGAVFSWIWIALGAIFFLMPLLATFEFSLRMERGTYSFRAYRVVFSDPKFQASLIYSVWVALVTIALSILLVVPTAFWVQLRVRRARGMVEFITLLPLVIPAMILVFGYIRMYDSSSLLPLTDTSFGINALLVCAYICLGLPYMYRSVETGLRALDVHTLAEAAQSLGAGWGAILWRVILPNIRSSIMSGAFLTFAIVIGEFTIAALLNCQTFGPYMQLVGANRIYEPSAMAVVAFLLTWGSMALMQFMGRGAVAAKR